MVSALVLPFWPTWSNLTTEWVKWDQALGHGSLIALATVYFLFTTAIARTLSRHTASRAYAGIAITVFFVLLATLSQRVALDAVTQLAMVGLLLGLTLVFFPEVTWLRALQVSGLLMFCLQAWGTLNPLLLWAASGVVGSAVSWLSIPTLIDGNSITLPHGIMVIADGCSGLRYFVIALALGWILGITNQYKAAGILVTLLIATALALIMNWIRIYALILIGYHSEMQSSLVHEHELFGWLLFAVIVLPALYFAPLGKSGAHQ
ncbi:MAG: archaeosortase/exosortase family protein [Natronospirillum sp.]